MYFCNKIWVMKRCVASLVFVCMTALFCVSCNKSGDTRDGDLASVCDSVAPFAVDSSDLSGVDYDFSGKVVFEDEKPVRTTEVDEPREESVQQPVRHKPYKRGKAYKKGFVQGYEQGKHDAYFCERYRYGLSNRSSYVGTEANEYEQGYRDGYDEAYNCNFQVTSNPQNPAWN